MEIIAQMNSVTKRFGDLLALDGLDLGVARGEAVALLGRNGAGKSTALSILQGMRPPTAGSARLFGQPAGSAMALARVGVTPQDTDFPAQATPRELIAFAGAHFSRQRATADLVEAFGLGHLIDRRVAGFSGGEKRRIALALAFVGDPDLVFLDEPTSGLDVAAQRAFNAVIRAYNGRGGTVILTSHNLVEVEEVCARVVLIDKGRKRLDGTIADIRAAVGLRTIRFRCAAPTPHIAAHYAAEEGGHHVAATADAESALRRLLGEPTTIENLTVEPMPLDQAIDRLATN